MSSAILSRRAFLELSALAGALVSKPVRAFGPAGKLLGTVPFVSEKTMPLETLVGSGLDARRALDLSTIDKTTLVTPAASFYIRTTHPDALPALESWTLAVSGSVDGPAALSLADLTPAAAPRGVHLLECAGNASGADFGLMSAASWTGIQIASVFERIRIQPRATRVSISGFDAPSSTRGSVAGASWIFALGELEAAGAFLATRMNDAPLPRDHGQPVRLVVPGWYACTCIKWVNAITFLDDTAPATAHMTEFAGRTYQDPYGPLDHLFTKRIESAGPRLAKDFKPATIDLAAMAVRVEKWRGDEGARYLVTGIVWGGDRLTRRLLIRFRPEGAYVPVDDFEHRTNATWSLWSHTFKPKAPGRYRIQLKADDPAIRTRRMDMHFYDREIDVDEAA